jgi:two-component system response regulator AtoC
MARGEFREDLWFRLSVFRIDIPPLRERREDLIPLAEGILADLRRELGRRDTTLGPRARTRLQAYAFPGNVRELRNLLERALVLESGPTLELNALAQGPLVTASAADPDAFVVSGPLLPLEDVERLYVRHVLKRLDGRRMEAASTLGISYPTFLRRLGEE